MPNDKNIPDFEKKIRELLADAVTYAEVTGVNFFKERFNEGGWRGSSFEPWPGRKSGADGRGILLRTAHLRDSIRVLDSSPLQIVFGTSAPYAQIHNEGGTILVNVTDKSRRFFWFMYKATGKESWKWMALTKKNQLAIKIPKRQYIGESAEYMRQLDEWLEKEIDKRFR